MQSARGERFSLGKLSTAEGNSPEDKAKFFGRSLLQRLYYPEVLVDFNVRPGKGVVKERLPFPADAWEFLKCK